MSSQYQQLVDRQARLPWIQPQPPTPPLAGRLPQGLNPPNTPIHRQNPQLGYESCWRRILESLNRSPGSLDAFVFLLNEVEESFRHFECLAVGRRYRLTLDLDGVSLNLAMTQKLWTELKSCRTRGNTDELRTFLQRHQGLLSSQPPPLRSNFTTGQLMSSSPPSPDQLRHGSSPRSPHLDLSRTPSVGSSATSESGECKGEWWCPLVARNYCKREPFKKWGNARNHVFREHPWYTDDHPDWQSEIRPVNRSRSPSELEPPTYSSEEAEFRQRGTGFCSPDTPNLSLDGPTCPVPSPRGQALLIQRKPVPLNVPGAPKAGLSSNAIISQRNEPNDQQDTVMDDPFLSDEFDPSLMFMNTMSQFDSNSFRFGQLHPTQPFQQRNPIRPSPWPDTRTQYGRFGADNGSGGKGQ